MTGHYILLVLIFSNATHLEIIKRNSTELRHMFGSESDLKKYVQNSRVLCHKTWGGGTKLLIFWWFYNHI